MSRPALLMLAALLAGAAPAAMAAPIAIIHARAFTMAADAPVEDATILVDGGRIVSVMPAGPVPAGAEVIDAAGQPVTPGLGNAATQLGLVEVSSASATRDGASVAAALSAGFDGAVALNGHSTLIALARADGLTFAIAAPGASARAPFNGLGDALTLRNGADVLGKPGVALFATIKGSAFKKQAGSRAVLWQMLEEALAEAARAAAKPGAAPLSADQAALAAVAAGRLPLAIETERESDIRTALALAARLKLRLVLVGAAEGWRAADAIAAAHVPVVLNPFANLPTSFDELGSRLDNAAILAAHGVTVAIGKAGGGIEESYNAGLALREGAGLAVANGLPHATGLAAIITAPRAIWGLPAPTLTAGAPADIVVWDGDPLEPATNARAVIIEGQEANLANRQRALAEHYLGGERR